MVSPLLLRALTRPHRGTRPVGACCASLHSSLPPRPSPATYPPTLVKEAEVVYSPMKVSHRTRGLFCALKDLGLSVCSRRRPGMFANIRVPLDGSALSEHALPMAQHLARSSETTRIGWGRELDRRDRGRLRADRGRGRRGAGDRAARGRRLREAQTARGRAYWRSRGAVHAGIPVTTVLREVPQTKISPAAQGTRVDLIVMSTHGYPD
jgi:nucleotide-binding universal stress UspA family protein